MVVSLKQNDTAPNLDYRFTIDGSPVDLSNVADIEFIAYNEYEEKVIDENLNGGVSVTNASSGEVLYDISASDTKNVGEFDAEWRATFNDGEVITFPNDGFLTLRVYE